ncbi:MAG TPA: limonene-1,2-epoxide hydrolase family protein [Rhizomicrobium sp.]|jgi:limonene-1,2-epoxide hydrolase
MTNSDRVKAFIAAWEARDVEAILAGLAPDAIYHNIPMQALQGPDAIRAFIAPFLAGATHVEWTVHHIAETAAGVVLTERTDVFVMGTKTISLPVMGTFEFKDGLISAWRDYFDLADFQKQMA